MNITNKIKPFRLTISQDFNEKTKIDEFLEQNPYEKWPREWKTVYFKGYPRFKTIELPQAELDSNISFKEVLFKRFSYRDFSGKPLQTEKLSSLLYYSAGIRKKKSDYIGNRFYPSAGSRYPLEVYPIIYSVEDVKPGIYHYYVKKHLLESLPKKHNYKSLSYKFFGEQPWVKKASLLLVISAVFYRTQVKYGERGYRHVLSEVGSIIQNIYLISTAINLGCCPTGGYIDNGYNSLLDLDGIEESVVGVVAVGNKT